MKLKQEFEKYQELYNKGFRFNPDDAVFYTTDPNKFLKPEGFEEWSVEKFERTAYLNERLKELGISDEENTIELIDEKGTRGKSREEFKVFSANQFGDIEILQYTLHRKPLTYLRRGKTNKNHEDYHAQIRLNPISEHICEGKYDFSDAKNSPFWHKSLIELFEAGEQVDTLTITEGQFKAYKASQDGIPTVGLTSISHFKEKATGKIHGEIVEFIRTCNVQKVVILWDGDCRDISLNQLEKGEDISKRPNNFFKFARAIREMLQEYFPPKRLSIFFATIRDNETEERAKGMDDLLIQQNAEVIKREIDSVDSLPGKFIYSENITLETGLKKMRNWFLFAHASDFYQFHKEKIRNKSFTYLGSTYKIENGHPIIEVSEDLKQYKAIGTDYYRLVQRPVPSGKNDDVILEEVLEPWKAETIKRDHGKDSVYKIEKLLGFTNAPSHVDFQQIIHQHWNLYYNVDHNKIEGEFPTIKTLLNHLFEEHEENEMIYDYLTVLYRHPTQKLPVICLVSEEQGTGKSTFLFLLKLIFKQNMSIISNNDLTGDFNSHWTSKLVVASEETLLEKKDGYEKIKSLSTAKFITRNEKNKTAKEIPCMVHFVFCSNHENDFIKINDYDSRLWIRKVKALKEQINDFDQKLEDEIPQLIHFIEAREIQYKKNGRMWFHPKDFRTDAFYNLVKHSEPGVIKEIREILVDSFFKHGGLTREMTAQDFIQYFRVKNTEINYLNKVIKSYLKVDRITNAEGKETVRTYKFPIDHNSDPNQTEFITRKGRPFVFHADKILSPGELRMIENIAEPVQEELPF